MEPNKKQVQWEKCAINKQNILYMSEKSTLIKMPNKSCFCGFQFWHPSKLIRDGRHSYEFILLFTDEFKFKIQKMSYGKYNKRSILDEKEITASEMLDLFQKVTRENTRVENSSECEKTIHIPDKIELTTVEIYEELKRESNASL